MQWWIPEKQKLPSVTRAYVSMKKKQYTRTSTQLKDFFWGAGVRKIDYINMNKRMDASKHPTKGLCTSKIDPIHEINETKRRGHKFALSQHKSLDKIIFDMSKRCLLYLKDSCFSHAK